MSLILKLIYIKEQLFYTFTYQIEVQILMFKSVSLYHKVICLQLVYEMKCSQHQSIAFLHACYGV